MNSQPSLTKLYLSYTKKNSRSYSDSNRHQQGNMLAIKVKVTTIAKDKRVEKNISQVECFYYHKKGYYANKCPDK